MTAKIFLVFLSLGIFACATRAPSPSEGARIIPLAVRQSAQERQQYEATGTEYMIAAQGKQASAAAQAMFEQGGNSIDAAIAASFVISVERPQSTGLGGGGFMLYREAKSQRIYAIDFRERAPLKASRNMYLDAKGDVVSEMSLNGIHSVAVPGLVAGLLEIHKKFGRLSRQKVMAPAIILAEQGVVVYPKLAGALVKRAEVLKKYPSSREIFIKPDGSLYGLGEKIVQKDLAKSLRLIAKQGSSAFYRGRIGQAIVQESQRQKGILSARDLTEYSVKWREALRGDYKGYSIYSMPPPSSGGIHVIEVLNILENDPLRELGFFSAPAIHRTAAALQLAFADRSLYLGDPDFVKVPVQTLISKDYARGLREKIKNNQANASQSVRPGVLPKEESLETTHFSIIDKDDNVVVSTQTINYIFGSGIVVPGTGILLNDEMDDFSTKPGVPNVFGAIGGDANAIAPGKTPLSSMSPTIVLKGNEPVLALGAPGGTRIISCVVETILNYLEYKLPLYEAVTASRIHHQWLPDRLDIDMPGPGDAVLASLKEMGYQSNLAEEAVPCQIEAVAKEANILHGVADPRDLGASYGR